MAEKEWSEKALTVSKDDTINLMTYNIWLQFKTITVGVGKEKKTFDLIKIFEGLERLAEVK